MAAGRRAHGNGSGRGKKGIGQCLCALLGLTLLWGASLFWKKDALWEEPGQDGDGYYMLKSREDFVWFVKKVRGGEEDLNARLFSDIVLNDTADREQWEDRPPVNRYPCMMYYNGHFDGNGHALSGYYSAQEAPVFFELGECSRVTGLSVQKSFFYTDFGEGSYLDDDGECNVLPAGALCYENCGTIENCTVEARVLGAWSAGGIAVVNKGTVADCRFLGVLEAGQEICDREQEERWAVETVYAGGICRTNRGRILDCTNESSVCLGAVTREKYMNYAAGGIAGTVEEEGTVENCRNLGSVTCVQLAGGIAGANTGRITGCTNDGSVRVEEDELGYVHSLITAGICASNGGMVQDCYNAGPVTIRQQWVSYFAPVYAIACNLINPREGQTKNCYYHKDSAKQEYRQRGVYKLREGQVKNLQAFLTQGYGFTDFDSWELLEFMPDVPGIDEEDFIRLGMGPKEDTVYTVKAGDSLWGIAEAFYGDGGYYPYLRREKKGEGDGSLFCGEEIVVPHLDFYLLHANDEEGFTYSYTVLADGTPCPNRYYAAKPADWCYGYMDFRAGAGLDVLWPKKKDGCSGEAEADIRIFYRLDANPGGDFFASDWEGVKKSLAGSAGLACGDALGSLRFYRYELDNGEFLYGCSFRLYRSDGIFDGAAFYRLRDGVLAEFIGVEPKGGGNHVLERTRYMAARVEDGPAVAQTNHTGEEFYGREGWDFTPLHNPFETAMAYTPQAACSAYVLFTGPQ